MGNGHLSVVPHTSHRLAKVMTFLNDGKAESRSTECIIQRFNNVDGESFLQLQFGCTIPDNSCNLGYAKNTTIGRWDVGKVILSKERQYMMLAHGIVIATIKDHIRRIVLISESRYLWFLVRVISTEYLIPHSDDAVWSLFRTLTVRIFPDV